MSQMTSRFTADLEGRDQLELEITTREGEVIQARLHAVGCPALMALVESWRARLSGRIEAWDLPDGTGHAEMLMRELLLKAKGEWHFPYLDEELCHCRAVPTARVDQAVLAGAKSVAEVSRRTSAGTACGTCRPDIQSVLEYRRGLKVIK